MQLGYSSDIYAALGNPGMSPAAQTRAILQQSGLTPVVVMQPASTPASAPSGLASSNPFDAGKVNVLEMGIFETAKSAFAFPAITKAVQAVKAVATTPASSSPTTATGSINFSGPNAFPAATQAAFGGMGGSGSGVGYGGFAQGATITIGAPIINVPSAASAPSGLGGDMSTILIGGVVMAAVLIIALLYRRR
jgi:hypothetical protein